MSCSRTIHFCIYVQCVQCLKISQKSLIWILRFEGTKERSVICRRPFIWCRRFTLYLKAVQNWSNFCVYLCTQCLKISKNGLIWIFTPKFNCMTFGMKIQIVARFARKCCKMRLFTMIIKLCADVCYSSSHCFTFCNFLRVFQLLQRTCHVLVTQYSMLMIWTLFSSVVHMGKTRWIDKQSEWETPQKTNEVWHLKKNWTVNSFSDKGSGILCHFWRKNSNRKIIQHGSIVNCALTEITH